MLEIEDLNVDFELDSQGLFEAVIGPVEGFLEQLWIIAESITPLTLSISIKEVPGFKLFEASTSTPLMVFPRYQPVDFENQYLTFGTEKLALKDELLISMRGESGLKGSLKLRYQKLKDIEEPSLEPSSPEELNLG